MTQTITIPGLSRTRKRPGFHGTVTLGAGALNPNSQPRRLLLAGCKTSAGSLTVDTQLAKVSSDDDIDAYCGAGSELALMAYKAILYPGVEVWVGAVAEAGGAAAAVATVTFTGTSTSAGTLRIRIGGYPVEYSFANGTTAAAAATALAALLGQFSKLAVTAAADTGVVTLTTKSKAARMNDLAVYIDQADMGTGLTAAVAGGDALPSSGAQTGCRFHNGSGADSAASMITALGSQVFDTIAFAHTDATNVDRWRDYVNALAAVGTQIFEMYITGHNLTYAAAKSIAQTTLNDAFGQVVHIKDCENMGSEIAASMGGLRQMMDAEHPNQSFHGKELLGIAPLVNASSVPIDSEIETALHEGVTPCVTRDGRVVVEESITTRCLNGQVFDDRCWRTGEARTPFRIFEAISLKWESEFSVENTHVGPDLPDGKAPREHLATPSLWRSAIRAILNEKEEDLWITNVEDNPPEVTYDNTFKGLLAQVNVEVMPVQNKTGVWVRQFAT